MWVRLRLSGMKGGGPDPGEADSDKGAFGWGLGWDEMKTCCYQETEKREERSCRGEKREMRKGREMGGTISFPSAPPHLSLSDAWAGGPHSFACEWLALACPRLERASGRGAGEQIGRSRGSLQWGGFLRSSPRDTHGSWSDVVTLAKLYNNLETI